MTAELAAAVFEMQGALLVHHAQWNTLRPRLMRVGLSALELLAGRASGKPHEGVVRAARAALDWGDSETAATRTLVGAPFSRVTAALARAALLPDQTIVDAVLALGEAMFATAAGYGGNGLYRKKAAEAAQERPTPSCRTRSVKCWPQRGRTSTRHRGGAGGHG